MTTVGYLAMLAFLVIEIIWYVLYRRHLISTELALGLVLVTFGFTLWIVPYVTPVEPSGSQAPRP